MKRRAFLTTLGKSALGLSGVLLVPGVLLGGSAFEYALKGQALIQKREFAGAAEALTRAVKLDPSSDWAFGLLGRALREMGRFAEAVDAFRQAIRINPEDTYSRMMIDIMTQKPLAGARRKTHIDSQAEQAALRETQAMAQKLTADSGLGYRVNRVVIDPGHGGFDAGAVGKNGLQEKTVTLDLARRLHQLLAEKGQVRSFLTRTGDYYVPLSERTVIANQHRADLFISIHINANKNRQAHGSETYFCSEKASGTEAARVAALENAVLSYEEKKQRKQGYIDIEQILAAFGQKLNWQESGNFAIGFQNRFKTELPFKSRGIHSANFFVLRKAKMPAILLEAGFISNPGEEALLAQAGFRAQIANAIARGIA
ncbi:MAG: tetratricopeptide repeat protein [Desulfobacterales bacterium]|nr:tetratricopeptide repeat protein [Desulfobacterales bacterium]